MDLSDLKEQFIREELGITSEYGRIFAFVDFGNVNRWFENDRQDWNNQQLNENQHLAIDLEKLKKFTDIFCQKSRIYYGEDPKNKRSLGFTHAMRKIFDKRNVVTKNIQRIKNYLETDKQYPVEYLNKDEDGRNYVEIRKCNFDVEISVDANKMLAHYDTFCLFSGDADFVYLNNFLKKKGKRVIIVKGGYILTTLRNSADLVVNAQNIKKHIACIKQRPD